MQNSTYAKFPSDGNVAIFKMNLKKAALILMIRYYISTRYNEYILTDFAVDAKKLTYSF